MSSNMLSGATLCPGQGNSPHDIPPLSLLGRNREHHGSYGQNLLMIMVTQFSR